MRAFRATKLACRLTCVDVGVAALIRYSHFLLDIFEVNKVVVKGLRLVSARFHPLQSLFKLITIIHCKMFFDRAKDSRECLSVQFEKLACHLSSNRQGPFVVVDQGKLTKVVSNVKNSNSDKSLSFIYLMEL